MPNTVYVLAHIEGGRMEDWKVAGSLGEARNWFARMIGKEVMQCMETQMPEAVFYEDDKEVPNLHDVFDFLDVRPSCDPNVILMEYVTADHDRQAIVARSTMGGAPS